MGVVILIILVLIYFIPTTRISEYSDQITHREQRDTKAPIVKVFDADVGRVSNQTLGFSKVFVLGLPERTDKRDAITLASALTGFKVEFIDGIRGETVPNKALPFGIGDRAAFMESNIGSWRGHMNAIQRYGIRYFPHRPSGHMFIPYFQDEVL